MASNPNHALRAALAGMLVMAIAMGIGRFVYTPLLPHMVEAGALDASEAGLVAGANYLGYLIGALVASISYLAPKRRMWAYAGLAASVLTTAALWVEPDLAPMAVIRFASGFASAFAMIFMTTIVMRRLSSDGRPSLIAYHFAGVGLGIAVSAVLVSRLAGAGFAWPQIWLAAGLLAAAMLVGVRLLLPPPVNLAQSPNAEDAPGEPFPAHLWVYIAGYGIFGFGYVITATFINAMAKSDPLLAPIEPWIWTMVGLAGIPSVWLWNKIAHKTGVARAFATACLVEAFGVGLPVFWTSQTALAISAVLLGGTFMAITALGLSHARSMSPHSPARAIALMTASFGLGQMIGPVVAGQLFEILGNLDLASLLAAAALALSALFSMGVERMASRSATMA